MAKKLVIAAASVAALLASGTAYALDFALQSNFGGVELTVGFLPDPHTVELIPGGNLDASTQGLPPGCVGFVTENPDFELAYTAGQAPLFIWAESTVDTTLIINLPDGSWVCDDDSAGNLDPGIAMWTPMSGVYDIWVGTFLSDSAATAVLAISEITPEGVTPPSDQQQPAPAPAPEPAPAPQEPVTPPVQPKPQP